LAQEIPLQRASRHDVDIDAEQIRQRAGESGQAKKPDAVIEVDEKIYSARARADPIRTR
jgi:hypothetical protein